MLRTEVKHHLLTTCSNNTWLFWDVLREGAPKWFKFCGVGSKNLYLFHLLSIPFQFLLIVFVWRTWDSSKRCWVSQNKRGKTRSRDAFETRQYQMETGPTLVATSVQSQVNWVWGVSANKAFDYPDDLWAPWVLDLKLKIYFPCPCSAPARTVHVKQFLSEHNICVQSVFLCMPWTCAWTKATEQDIWLLEGPLGHSHDHNAQV